jgi:hypothetical protein
MEEKKERGREKKVTSFYTERHLRYILAKHKTQENLWYSEQSQFHVQCQYC